MFERYIKEQKKLPLPLSANLYFVEINGRISDNQNQEIKPYANLDNELCINISWVDGFKEYKVADLVAHTFKPVKIVFSQWKYIKVLFKDNDKLNLHPANLVWKFPSGGLESNRLKGFYYIPNFTKYLINKDGKVIQFTTGNIPDGSTDDKGYHKFTLSPDVKDGRAPTIGRHRLLAMVFLEYGSDVNKLDVNHINGIPGDDRITNLEWTTRKQNMIHAFSHNLRTDNKPVIVINHNTGEETKYFSAHECERSLGLGRSNVHYRIKHGSGRIYPPGFSFRYEKENYEKCNEDRYGIKVKLLNTLTNEVNVFDSITACSRFLNVSKKVIQRRLKNSSKGIFKNYSFERQ